MIRNYYESCGHYSWSLCKMSFDSNICRKIFYCTFFTMSTNALLFTMFALRELFLFFNVLYFNILCNFHCICSICLCLWFNRKEIFQKVIWNFMLLLQRTVCSKRWTFLNAFLITSTISMLLFRVFKCKKLYIWVLRV